MITTLLAFLLALGILVVIHELGHYWVGRWCGVQALRFSVGFGRILWRRTDRHGTEWALSAIPLGGYVKFLDGRETVLPPEQANRAFDRQSVWRRIAIVLAGPVANLLLASLLYAGLFMSGVTEPEPGQGPPLAQVQSVLPDSAAAEAGVREGDVFLALNRLREPDPQTLVETIAGSGGQPLEATLQRGNEQLQTLITPRVDAEDGVARIGVRLGVNLRYHEVQYGPIESLWRGVERTGDMVALTLRMFWRMVTGQASWSHLSGPVTIADYAGQTARIGLDAYVAFLAIVSVSLGVLNLLPIPMLDGGHLLYYLVEIVRGSPPPERWFEIGHRAGLALLLALMSVALFNDFARLLG